MVKVACYKSMIRQILEYASTVWSPYTKKNILMIEAVQRRAARFVTNTYNRTSSVTAMLFRLGWPSLEQRREIAKTIMMYKILHNMVAVPFDKYRAPQYYYLYKRPLAAVSSSCSTCECLSLFILPVNY